MTATLQIPLDIPDIRLLSSRHTEQGELLLQVVIIEIKPKRFQCRHCEGKPATTPSKKGTIALILGCVVVVFVVLYFVLLSSQKMYQPPREEGKYTQEEIEEGNRILAIKDDAWGHKNIKVLYTYLHTGQDYDPNQQKYHTVKRRLEITNAFVRLYTTIWNEPNTWYPWGQELIFVSGGLLREYEEGTFVVYREVSSNVTESYALPVTTDIKTADDLWKRIAGAFNNWFDTHCPKLRSIDHEPHTCREGKMQ